MDFRQASIDAQAQVVREMAENDGRVPKLRFDGSEATVSEMIGTDDGAREFLETVTYQAYEGREAVPLLYKGLYAYKENANFPRTMTEKQFGAVQVVFLKKLEGGEVKFGTLAPGTEKTVSFDTWAAGLEYDEDIKEYNEYWRLDDIGLAFGEAYNKLLNHLHLGPIIDEPGQDSRYVKTGTTLAQQKAAQDAGTAQLIEFRTDIRTTLEDALQVLPRGRVMLHNSFDVLRIGQAIDGDVSEQGTSGLVKRSLSLEGAIEYDGAEVTVGDKEYVYWGVPSGVVYLGSNAKANFTEYVKHDLRVDNGDGDLSRLILDQVVGRARRAVLAALGGKDGFVKVELEA